MVVKKTKAAAAKGGSNTATLVMKKETAGALQYDEINPDGSKANDATGAVMGSLYLRKAKLAGAVPKKITVTVEY